jgi:hypothetical protein
MRRFGQSNAGTPQQQDDAAQFVVFIFLPSRLLTKDWYLVSFSEDIGRYFGKLGMGVAG